MLNVSDRNSDTSVLVFNDYHYDCNHNAMTPTKTNMTATITETKIATMIATMIAITTAAKLLPLA